jgi:hypothetical protein
MNWMLKYIEKRYKRSSYYKSYYYKNSFYVYDFNEMMWHVEISQSSFNTVIPILFKGKVKFGNSAYEIINKYGKPRYQEFYNNLKSYQVLHYKQLLNTYKIRSQFHFFEDTFFMAFRYFLI